MVYACRFSDYGTCWNSNVFRPSSNFWIVIKYCCILISFASYVSDTWLATMRESPNMFKCLTPISFSKHILTNNDLYFTSLFDVWKSYLKVYLIFISFWTHLNPRTLQPSILEALSNYNVHMSHCVCSLRLMCLIPVFLLPCWHRLFVVVNVSINQQVLVLYSFSLVDNRYYAPLGLFPICWSSTLFLVSTIFV